jgi:hypothetical protein
MYADAADFHAQFHIFPRMPVTSSVVCSATLVTLADRKMNPVDN